jgi:hypothetical protein
MRKTLVGKPQVKDPVGGIKGVDRRIILKWILRKWGVNMWAAFSCLRIVFWRFFVSAVTNICVPRKQRNFFTS